MWTDCDSPLLKILPFRSRHTWNHTSTPNSSRVLEAPVITNCWSSLHLSHSPPLPLCICWSSRLECLSLQVGEHLLIFWDSTQMTPPHSLLQIQEEAGAKPSASSTDCSNCLVLFNGNCLDFAIPLPNYTELLEERSDLFMVDPIGSFLDCSEYGIQ